jgi:hypothetical protein
VYVNGKEVGSFADMEDDTDMSTSARALAIKFANGEIKRDDDAKVSVCWKADDNDPRIGKVWFTSFYRLF